MFELAPNGLNIFVSGGAAPDEGQPLIPCLQHPGDVFDIDTRIVIEMYQHSLDGLSHAVRS